MIMSNPTGPLTANELDTLNTLLRRFLDDIGATTWRSEILATQGAVRQVRNTRKGERAVDVKCECMGANPDGSHARSCPVTTRPMTTGPDPIPVSELLNQGSVLDAAGLASWRS
jgi:hypothetical protein